MARKTDEIIKEHGESSVRLEVRLIDDDTVLIGGNASGLRFLAELLQAHADDVEPDKTQIHPSGAGSAFFDRSSTLGLYLSRTK